MSMSYGHANYINQRSALSLATEKFTKGQSLVNAIGSSLSDKTAAKFTNMKERLDPMSWSRKIGGKLGAGIYGRMMGRSAEDMYHYTGVRPKSRIRGNRIPTSKSKNPNINPLYTKISSTSVTPVRKNDSVSDILSKIYNYIKIGHEKDIKLRELRHNNKKGLLDDADKKHKAFLKTLAADDKAGPSGGGGGDSPWTDIFDKIFDLGKFVLGASLIKKLLNRRNPKPMAEKLGGKKLKEKSINSGAKNIKKKGKGKGVKPKTSRTKSVRSPMGTKPQGPAIVNEKPVEKFKAKSPKTPEEIKKGIEASKRAKTAAYNKEYPTNTKGGIKPTTVKVANAATSAGKIITGTGKKIGETASRVVKKTTAIGVLGTFMKLKVVYDTWKEIKNLNPKDFKNKDAYSNEVFTLIGKAILEYSFIGVMVGLGGFIGASLGLGLGSIPGFIIGLGLGWAGSSYVAGENESASIHALVKKIVDFFWINTNDVEDNALNEKGFVMSDLKGPKGEKAITGTGGATGYRDEKGFFHKFEESKINDAKKRAKEHLLKTNPLAQGIAAVGGVTDELEKKVDDNITSPIKDKLKEHGWMDGKPTEDIIKESVVNALSSVVTAAHNAPKLHIEKGSVLAKAIDEYNRTITEVETQRDSNIGKNNVQEMTAPPVYANTGKDDVKPAPTAPVRNDKMNYKYIPYAG